MLSTGSGAHGSCNLIPQAQQAFRAPLGTIDRPFASPGDPLEIDVRSDECDQASLGLQPSAEDHVVTVVFKPPQNGQRHVVVMTSDCAAIASKLALCQQALGNDVDPPTCVELGPSQLELRPADDRPRLRFPFPLVEESLPGGDLVSRAGPVAIAVTRPVDALPCQLATTSCANVPGGLIACVDDLRTADGSCSASPDPVFPSFTALPPANDYQRACFSEDPPCTAEAEDVRFTMDAAGNLLLPMNWDGVLVDQEDDDAILPRLLHVTVRPPVPLPIPREPPAASVFLRSFTPEGAPLPPIFEPQADPTLLDPQVVSLFGSADAPASVLRIAHRRGRCSGGLLDGQACETINECQLHPCVAACSGCNGCNVVNKKDDGEACATAAECKGGLCGETYTTGPIMQAAATGNALQVTRAPVGIGICEMSPAASCTTGTCSPDNGMCVSYALQAFTATHLASLTGGSSDVLVLLVPEGVVGDVNLDGDEEDLIAELYDRRTGSLKPLGAALGYPDDESPAACIEGAVPGRTVVTVVDPENPFARRPAFATDGAVMAFLESEVGNGYCDQNDDNDRGDAVLRLFKLNEERELEDISPGAEDSPEPATRAVDAAPVIDRRSLAFSGHKLFYRASEAAMAPQTIETVSLANATTTGNGGSPRSIAVSPTGRCVAFDSDADNLPALPSAGDNNGTGDVYLRDLVSDITRRISMRNDNSNPTRQSIMSVLGNTISSDCRFVVYQSEDTNILNTGGEHDPPAEINPDFDFDVFVRDRCQTNGSPVVSDPPCGSRSYLVSRANGEDGARGNGESGGGPITPDGRFIVFWSVATNLTSEDTDPKMDVFIRDRCISNGEPVVGCTESTELVSKPPESTACVEDPCGYYASVSDDGRFVAFRSGSNNFGQTGATYLSHTWVRDRCHSNGILVPNCEEKTELVDVGEDGTPSEGCEHCWPRISADGRYVGFFSRATDLVEEDTTDDTDIFIRDRILGHTELVSVGTNGADLEALDTGNAALSFSADNRLVGFEAVGATSVPGVTGQCECSTNAHCTSGTCSGGICTTGPDSLCDADDDCAPSFACINRSQIFLYDRVTRLTDRVTLGSGTHPEQARRSAMSDDARVIAFQSKVEAGDLQDGIIDTNDSFDVFVRRPEDSPNLALLDLDSDGALDDTVLEALDPANGQVTTIGPSADVSVTPTTGMALYLAPDPLLGLLLTELWPVAGMVQNPNVAATAVATSDTRLAALVSESGEEAQLNADGDALDDVVHVRRPIDASWTNLQQAADTVRVCGDVIVFLTPEAAQCATSGPACSLNGDGDDDDRVIHIYDAAAMSPTVVSLGYAAEDFVCSSELLAFRTREASQDAVLNGDGDTLDDVLQVWNLEQGACRAASPPASCRRALAAVQRCDFEACDPRTPYLVSGATVKFITPECSEGGGPIVHPPCTLPGGIDLNVNEIYGERILQVFDFEHGLFPLISVDDPDVDDPFAGGDDDDGGTVISTSQLTCIETFGACDETGDCASGQTCEDSVCTLDHHRPCTQSPDDCPAGTCQEIRVTAASPDSDGDGVPDHVDNCPFVRNTSQSDLDMDGVGDDVVVDAVDEGCDAQVCGNGVAEGLEVCDATDASQCAGPCLSTCRCGVCGVQSVGGLKDKVVVNARNGVGLLVAKLQLDLSALGPQRYTNQQVTVTLSDTVAGVLASTTLTLVPPQGTSGTKWQFKTKADGLQKVQLKSLEKKIPGRFQLVLKARRFFGAATDTVGNTRLTVTIGGRCFTHVATKKS